ncbi:MAG: hypothetical protein KatS3mg060_2648 [Dehalococcoidia bacterium]|nr:MAG: hypothetical protein KatS3mg060_2648 [Dehalococcoidia bacterium]
MVQATSLPVIMLRVEDVDGVAAFYRDGLGLPVANHHPGRVCQLFLPGWSILEIGMGGRRLPIPADRSEAPATLIFEVADIEAALAHLTAIGGTLVNPPFKLSGFAMAYVADPEGHLVGLTKGLEARVNALRAGTLRITE